MKRICHATAVLSLLGSLGFGAIRWANSAGNAQRRTDFTDIHFKLNSNMAQTIVADGSAAATVQAALNAWNNVPFTAVHFAPLGITSAGADASDGQNVITLADTPATRSVVGSALATTLIFSMVDGRITDTDIVFNPDIKFSVTQVPGTSDLQSTITHELGHALGANHAVIVSATMFYKTDRGSNVAAQLKPDDASFVVDVYPGPGADSAYGSLTGTALKDGMPLPGAEIIAADAESGVSIGGLSSLSDGSFSLKVPIGNYVVFAAPLSGLVQPVNLYNVPVSKVDTGFRAAVAGTSDAPAVVPVLAGRTTPAPSITALAGTSAIGISAAGTAEGSSYAIGLVPVLIQSGQPVDIIVSGPGLDASITEQNLHLIGPGVQIRAGTLRFDPSIVDAQGRSPIRFTVDVAPRSSRASVNLFIARGADTALLAGGILIVPPKPFFRATNLVDAASFNSSGVAPGELVTLFGTNVGPDSPVSNSGFDPATGALPTTLAGVSVTFDGIPAPLIFTAAGQINLQVPYEVAGRGSTVVVVQGQGGASDPITVPVVPAQPAFFTQGGTTQAIAVNEDGSINSSSHPAPKGSTVTLFATGAGVVDPPVRTGRPAPGLPLSSAIGASLKVGGADARVTFAGLTPGLVGLLQLNIEIPQGARSGLAPLELTVADRKTGTPAATLSIQ